jgi:hypothetical protein
MTQQDIDRMLTGKELRALLFLIEDAGAFSLAPLAEKLGETRDSAKSIMLSAAKKLHFRMEDIHAAIANLPENNIARLR